MTKRLSLIVALAATASAAVAADWHHPLYLGNGELWAQRVPITVTNDMDRDVEGEPVAVNIGTGAGEANLVGAMAESIRVCDAEGAEMLYDVTGPGGAYIRSGPIPAGSTLTIPVECAARQQAVYYAYFDNASAWRVPDFLNASLTVRNAGVEEGVGDAPAGWNHDAGDDQHTAMWVSENPHSGEKCLKTVVTDGAEPTWIATRQGAIHIIGGAQYRMTAWVKAENVKGNAGWYIHVGNETNYMIISPMLNGGEGTYDWKQVTADFQAPEDANRADLGTVLRGTGTAWFDDVVLETLAESDLTATASAGEALEVSTVGELPDGWYEAGGNSWEYRIPIKVINLSDEPLGKVLVSVDMRPVLSRLHGRINEDSIRIVDGLRAVPFSKLAAALLFEGEIPARTVRYYYAYFSADAGIKSVADSGYGSLLNSERNLVQNPSFEQGDALPDNWSGGAEGEKPAGTEMAAVDGGLFGERCVRMHIPAASTRSWTGWRQDVPVEAGKQYLFAAWLKTEDIAPNVQLHAHFRNAEGELCETQKHTGAGPAIGGTKDWTMISGLFTMPDDIATFQLHLTMNATGTVWHDGVLLADATGADTGRLESRAPRQVEGVTVWPVNAVVKVFPDDVPPREIPLLARISCARNEKEPLQLAVRSPVDIGRVHVDVNPPGRPGKLLDDVEITVVGYVPIDHKTSYYSTDSPTWHRKFPTNPGACDGWAGVWPDPLLPRETFDLAANTTQPIWVTVSVPKDAPAGDYTGSVRFLSEARNSLAEVPFTVHVYDFTLPDENHVAAIYDVRQRQSWWQVPGQSAQQTREDFWQFMAERRTCPDRIQPNPSIRYENGQVIADFADFDKAAAYYFDVLGFKHSYTPWYFYGFGWGHPPGKKFGQDPYPGEYPYEDADRSAFTPEFKEAYQACLKAYWDHVKEKGWADKITLYISDEPYDRYEHIIKQMKALCDMIHEVDPSIPIYSSTWRHIPEWNGYLDVWGIGHYGGVPVDVIGEIKDAGDTIWWTTDGQMCTDTPYCGVERLLPYYCFKYGADAYEFWGVDWLTYNPYDFGWHRYIHQSGEPGKSTWVRYPNGDGFLAYPPAILDTARDASDFAAGSPGEPGVKRLAAEDAGFRAYAPEAYRSAISSVRLEQAREGVEDYEYLYILRDLVAQGKAAGRDVSQGEKALALADALVEIPNAGGRYSTKILPNPDAVLEVKQAVAEAIEALK